MCHTHRPLTAPWLNGESLFWDHDEFWADTGQDAHEVLAEWLEGRE